jgi:O-antigen/teichoic acid export membrane protein
MIHKIRKSYRNTNYAGLIKRRIAPQMGIVIRQSIRTVAVTYFGIALGFVNTLWFYPLVLSKEEIGLTRTLISVGVLLATFASLGTGTIPVKFFPYFKDKAKQHSGFLFFLLVLGAAGFTLFLIAFVLFQSTFVRVFSAEAPLLVRYMYYLVPLTAIMITTTIFESYLTVQQMPVVPSFIREVLIRFSFTCGLLAIAAHWIGFPVFVSMIIVTYGLGLAALIGYTAYKHCLFLAPNFTIFKSRYLKSVAVFGGFVILGNASGSLIATIDGLMLSAYKGLGSTGIYTIAFFVATVIEIPKRSLSQVVIPMVAEANKNKDVPKLEELYKKSSINQLIIGGLIFLGIWCNIDNIYRLIPNGAIYSQGKWVVFYIGLAKIFDMVTSINGEIIGTSKYYRMDLFFLFLLGAFGIFTNWVFIPILGMTGAAVATALSVFLFNTIRFIYILIKFRIHPFSFNTIKIFVLAALVLLGNAVLPPLSNAFADIVYRSLCIGITFVGLTVAVGASVDINTTLMKVLRLLRERIG